MHGVLVQNLQSVNHCITFDMVLMWNIVESITNKNFELLSMDRLFRSSVLCYIK